MTDHLASDPSTAEQPGNGRPLRRLVLAAVAAVGAIALVVALIGGDDASTPSAGAEVLDVELTTVDGDATTLAAYRGEPLVVNFFASWCPPCRAEMPDFERAHLQTRDRVRFLGVNVDYDTTSWKSMVAESGITYETVYEPRQDLLRAVGGTGMPTTVLIDPGGRIVHVHTGALSETALLDLIEQKLPA
jgi:cytochrome c biogenesis protein CcmG, thiol:disulfide interchange protein DsbE